MNENYYYVGASLPRITLEDPADITLAELFLILKENLSERDYQKVFAIRLYYDLMNIKASYVSDPFDKRANLSKIALDDALMTQSDLPSYVFDVLDSLGSDERKVENFSSLLTTYFKEEGKRSYGFLKNYLEFERKLRLILLAFRAKERGLDLISELRFEDPNDDFVREIIASKDAPSLDPPEPFEKVKKIFEKNQGDPIHLEQDLIQFRLNKIKEMGGTDLFSLDFILSFLVQLCLIERWQHLDKKEGLMKVETLMKEAS